MSRSIVPGRPITLTPYFERFLAPVNDPEKNYHLEFVLADLSAAEQLRDLINAFGLDAKVVERKEHYIVYLKEGEQIVDLLNIMEAPLALMDLENVRLSY